MNDSNLQNGYIAISLKFIKKWINPDFNFMIYILLRIV